MHWNLLVWNQITMDLVCVSSEESGNKIKLWFFFYVFSGMNCFVGNQYSRVCGHSIFFKNILYLITVNDSILFTFSSVFVNNLIFIRTIVENYININYNVSFFKYYEVITRGVIKYIIKPLVLDWIRSRPTIMIIWWNSKTILHS